MTNKLSAEEQALLEKKGFRVTTVQEFLGLTETENREVEERLKTALAAKKDKPKFIFLKRLFN